MWPSKPDSAPVRGDGYEPGSSKFRLRANAETSHSSAIGPGGGEKFSHGMVRSRKPPLLVPLHDNDYHYCSSIKAPVRSSIDARHSITSLNPNGKHQRPLTSTNERIKQAQTSKYTAPPNPQGNRPRSMRSLAVNYQILSSLDCDPWFSLSPFNGVVTLRKGLAGA